MQSTSLEARKKIQRTLCFKQAEALKALQLSPSSLTNSELAKKLTWPINTVTPRVYELRQKGFVKEDCKRICSITGRVAIAWRIKRPDEIKERQLEMEL